MTRGATYQNNNALGNARVHYGDNYKTTNYNLATCLDDEQRVKSLKFFDPRITKGNILLTKEELFRGSSQWILRHRDYVEWYNSEGGRLLWLTGDPGKGKTMLLIGITDELERICGSDASPMVLAYFFCRGSDPTLNNATSILKGLIYMLIEKQGSLAFHLSDRFDIALSTDDNAFFVMSQVLESILDEINGSPTYLVIDALDECEEGLSHLLRFIQASKSTSRVKWLVSSRKNQGIRERLGKTNNRILLNLEMNEALVTSSVEAYINYKAVQLNKLKGYNPEVTDKIKAHLCSNANGTFLWVALACRTLEENHRVKTLKILDTMPSGLSSFYKTMMDQIRNQGDDEDTRLRKRVISLMTIAHQPIHLSGLVGAIGYNNWSGNLQDLEDLVSLCGSFLVVRNSLICWIHPSAMDYVMANEAEFIISDGLAAIHQEIVLHSLQVMSNTLKKDIYNLKSQGHCLQTKSCPVTLML